MNYILSWYPVNKIIIGVHEHCVVPQRYTIANVDMLHHKTLKKKSTGLTDQIQGHAQYY